MIKASEIRSLFMILAALAVITWSNGPLMTVVHAAEKGFITPAKTDKCPVCGMFVYKYPNWVAEAVFRDGIYRIFDGPKDLFNYLANVEKYTPGLSRAQVSAIFVTDYYSVQPIDGFSAYYVVGSDVYGPMGAEFIPFQKESDAKAFRDDHAGKSVIRFKDVTAAVLKGME